MWIFLLFIIADAANIVSKESVTTDLNGNDEDGKIYCGKINMNAEDITYTIVDRTENKISLNVSEAFEKDNVEGFSIAKCVQKVSVNFDCESKENCCRKNKTKIILPSSDQINSFNINACGERKYICLSYMKLDDSEWHSEGTKLYGLHSCNDDCKNINELKYKQHFKEFKVSDYVDKKTGHYKVDWFDLENNNETVLGCVDEVTLTYSKSEGLKDRDKEIRDTLYTREIHGGDYHGSVRAKGVPICGFVSEAYLEFRINKRKQTFKKVIKLRSVPECHEKISTPTLAGIIIGIIAGVVIIGILFYFLFTSKRFKRTTK